MNGKQLLLIGFLLSVLILIVPVSAIFYYEPPYVECGSGGNYECDPISGNITIGDTYAFAFDHRINAQLYCNYTGGEKKSPAEYCSVSSDPAIKTYFGNYYTDRYASACNMPSDCEVGDSLVICDDWGICPSGDVGIWTVVEGIPPVVDFTSDITSGYAPLTVNFWDISSFAPSMVNYWDYGDGISYTAPTTYDGNAQHIFYTAGWYDISHFAVSGAFEYGWGNKSSYIEVLSTVNQSSGGYTLSVSPASVNYNENFTISLSSVSGNFTGVQEVRFGWTQITPADSDILYDKDDYTLDYTLNNGTWYQYDGTSFSINKGATFPSPIILVPANFGSGVFIIDAYLIKTNNQVIHITAPLTITTTNLQTLTIHAIDYNDGYIVSTARIKVLDISHNTWDNRSTGGDKVFYYPYGQKLYINVNSSVYYDSFKNYTVTSAPTNLVEVVMYRGINTPVGNVTLRVNVMDTLGGYLNNAKVTVLNDDAYFDSQSKYTNYAGIATFIVLPSTDYVISVSKTGYLSAGKLVNSGSGGLTLDTTIVLSAGSNPTATPTPLPTTAQGGYIGNIGGSNLTPVSCQTTLPRGATLLDTLKNNMACAGIQSGQNQGFGIALMIIFTLGIIGGKYGKGMGVVMGMAAGYVLSLAMNLVPLWTFIALIVFICLILAVKIWSADGK